MVLQRNLIGKVIAQLVLYRFVYFFLQKPSRPLPTSNGAQHNAESTHSNQRTRTLVLAFCGQRIVKTRRYENGLIAQPACHRRRGAGCTITYYSSDLQRPNGRLPRPIQIYDLSRYAVPKKTKHIIGKRDPELLRRSVLNFVERGREHHLRRQKVFGARCPLVSTR